MLRLRQRCNDSAFLGSRLTSDSEKVFGFNSNSTLQGTHCIKTQFKIQFDHQFFISIQFTSQFSSPTSSHIDSNSLPLDGGHVVFWQLSPLGYSLHSCWVNYIRIQLEIEPQPRCCKVWLVLSDRMKMCSKRRKYIVKYWTAAYATLKNLSGLYFICD